MLPTRPGRYVVSASAAALVSTLAVAACAGDAGTETGSSEDRTDALGSAEAIHNSATEVGSAPRLRLEQELRIGSVDGPAETQFSSISDIEPGSSGELYVLDSRQSEVRVFEAAGRLSVSFGRRGEGPGEFQTGAYALALARDTVIVFETTRVHLFTPAGELIETRPNAQNERIRYDRVQAIPGGWLVAKAERPVRTRGDPGPYTDTLTIRPFDPATAMYGDRILVWPEEEYHLLGDAGWLRTPLLAPVPRYAIAPDGRLYVNRGDDYRIDVFSASGELERRITAEVERTPVTDADLDESLRRELARFEGRRPEGGESAELYDMLVNDAPSVGRADARPVPGAMLASAGGRLLVHRLDLDPDPLSTGDDSTWDLFDADGRIAGRFIVPYGTVLHAFDGERIYARVTDDIDVQHVARYRLVPDRVGRPAR